MKPIMKRTKKALPDLFTGLILAGMTFLVIENILEQIDLPIPDSQDSPQPSTNNQEVGEIVTTYTEFHTTLRQGFSVVTGHQFQSRSQTFPSYQFCYLHFGIKSRSIFTLDHTLADKTGDESIDWTRADDKTLQTVSQEIGINVSIIRAAKDDCVFIESDQNSLKTNGG